MSLLLPFKKARPACSKLDQIGEVAWRPNGLCGDLDMLILSGS